MRCRQSVICTLYIDKTFVFTSTQKIQRSVRFSTNYLYIGTRTKLLLWNMPLISDSGFSIPTNTCTWYQTYWVGFIRKTFFLYMYKYIFDKLLPHLTVTHKIDVIDFSNSISLIKVCTDTYGKGRVFQFYYHRNFW